MLEKLCVKKWLIKKDVCGLLENVRTYKIDLSQKLLQTNKVTKILSKSKMLKKSII